MKAGWRGGLRTEGLVEGSPSAGSSAMGAALIPPLLILPVQNPSVSLELLLIPSSLAHGPLYSSCGAQYIGLDSHLLDGTLILVLSPRVTP